MTDHLAALFLAPVADVGSGSYLPGRFDLHLRGDADLNDRLVHYHEAHHAILTATTSWGAALIVAAEMPQWQPLFGKLLDRCRITHESFATYLSCAAVAAGFGSPAAALAAYPDYVRLIDRLDHHLTSVGGPHRRALAVTAIMRACMQTAILDRMIASWPQPITVGSMPRVDLPDERLEYLFKNTREPVATTAAAADAAVAQRFGRSALDADLVDGTSALDDRFDPAWALWEDTVYSRIADLLRAAGATVPDSNGHMAAATQLAILMAAAIPSVELVVDQSPETSYERLAGIVLRHARQWLAALRRPGRILTVGVNTDIDELVEVADATSRLGGRPNLVLSVRMPVRLLAGYDYPDAHAAALRELADVAEPVVGVRSLADDGDGNDAVWFVRLPEPDDVPDLVAAWAGRGDLSCCVALSCLDHPEWRADWLPLLREAGPLVWLIDVGVSSLAGEFGNDRTVHGLYLDLEPADSARRGVVFKVSGSAGLWLAVGDSVRIELLVEQVAELPGIDLRMTGADWTAALPTVRLVLLDLLRTESYLDLRGHMPEDPS